MASADDQIKSFLQDIAKKENYLISKIDIQPISSQGANYTTDLFLATISEPNKADINIFGKTANLGEDTRKNNEFMGRVYEAEASFYNEMVPAFERIYNNHQVPAEDRLIIPKYYGHVMIPYKETLALENLEASGFKNYDRMKTFNWEYAATGVTQMAKFHALGLAFRDENPEEFEKIVSNFILDKSNMMNPEMTNNFIRMAIENGCDSLNSEHKKRLENYMSSPHGQAAMMKPVLEDKTMLTHGDFRPSNLMHRRRNGKLQIVPLDYQTLGMGNPVCDLMHFIFSGSDEEFRRFHYQNLVELYFAQLTLALKQVNVDVEKVYPRKTFDDDLITVRPNGLLIGLIMIGVVTVDPESAPKLDGDISSMQVKPNQLAQERIGGIVRDYIRWGNGKLQIVPLDYQTLGMGNPVCDLMHFIFSGSDEEFRRFHYQNLVELYFAQLTLALKQVNVDVEKVYPRKTFDDDLITVRPNGLLIGLIMIGVVTVDPESAPKLDGDISSMQVKPNQLAQERIGGIVRDYIRWGVI